MIITSLRFCLSLLNLPANYEETYAFALVAEVLIATLDLIPGVGPVLGKTVKLLDALLGLNSSQSEESDALKKIIEMLSRTDSREFGVVAISACNYDYFIRIEKILIDFECQILSREEFPGGSGANTICGLAKLCAPHKKGEKISIVSCVKNDDRGQKIIESFNDYGVDIDLLIRDDTPNQRTGVATILVELSGKREILLEPGVNDSLSKLIKERDLLNSLENRIKNSKIIHLTSFADEEEMELQKMVLERYKEKDTVVSVTPGALYVKKGLDKLFPILNHANLVFLYKEQLDELLKGDNITGFNKNLSIRKKCELFFKWKVSRGIKQPMLLVVKDSIKIHNGQIRKNYISIASSFNKKMSFFGHSNVNFSTIGLLAIVDTTGAGDAIAAGFLYGLLKGKENIKSYANIGFVLATYVSTRFGARPGLIDSDALGRALEKLE
jgi:ribokinase